jgi:sterol desaturase/sphingolipid hydroxylase (fatty acid hydroxylase superfamily)
MNIERLIPAVLATTFLFFVAVEALHPARPLPRVSGWKTKGVLAFFVTGAVSSSVPLFYMDFVRAHRLLHLEGLGVGVGTAIAFLSTELFAYWVHRLSHTNPFWRAYHQVHHSAERVDIYGSAYFHPMEIAIGGFVSAVVSTMVMGVSAEAAALAGLIGVGLSMFQHTNTQTPRWLGYVLPRPESHSVHHARGCHSQNYSRLPLIDLVFGTFQNPERFEPDTGFYPGASRRVLEALVGVDVSVPRDASRSRSRRLVTS